MTTKPTLQPSVSPLFYVGVALGLVGYGGQLVLHVRNWMRERRARRVELPIAQVHNEQRSPGRGAS